MIEFERKVGQKGQVVLPKELRKMSGLKPFSSVYLTIEDKKIIIKSSSTDSVEQFLSIIPKEKRKRLNVKDIKKWYDEEMEDQ